MDYKIEPIESIEPIKRVGFPTYKRRTLKGMYYTQLMKRIENASKQQSSNRRIPLNNKNQSDNSKG